MLLTPRIIQEVQLHKREVVMVEATVYVQIDLSNSKQVCVQMVMGRCHSAHVEERVEESEQVIVLEWRTVVVVR